jgi:cardiolipin synthase A/B
MGAQYYPMLPIQPFRGQLRRIDMRNHRKIVVIAIATNGVFAGWFDQPNLQAA